MIECFSHSDALCRIKCEKPLNEMEELPVDVIRWRYDLLDTQWSERLAGSEHANEPEGSESPAHLSCSVWRPWLLANLVWHLP